MQTYQGSCHCGAIQFEFTAPTISSSLRCNCSFCKRRGAVMSDFMLAPEELKITIQNDALATYAFGSEVAKHHFCKHCGIYPFHQTLRKPGHYRVNLGCIDSLDALSLPAPVFNGAAL
ncbi:GFA family protein [Thiofilum flexile]|uniref:GFA family protein n=1 Tax=Thiofilum flexile TaxID=125627 RepID=UPI0003802AB3|nr:GFA family protein [Thiofilum flexile]